MGIVADILNLPEDLARAPAIMRTLLPTACLISVGVILGAPGALHLGAGRVPAALLALFSPWMWIIASAILLVLGFNRLGDVVKKGVTESGPSLERSKEFIRVVGSMDQDELTALYEIAKGTEGLTADPASMAIDAAGRLTSLTRKNSKLFPTDGHNQIWIAGPYRLFVAEWAKGRTA